LSIKILVVDDHQLFLDGLEFILRENAFEVECVSTIDDAKIFLQPKNGFDLALIDIDLSGTDGLQILNYVRSEKLLIPIITISANLKPALISRCFALGASGYIPKSLSASAMIGAINQVLSGINFIPDNLKNAISQYDQKIERLSKLYGIRSRQLEVLKYMETGLSNKDIGKKLFISEATVKSHVATLFKAMNAKNRVDCLNLARIQGLLD